MSEAIISENTRDIENLAFQGELQSGKRKEEEKEEKKAQLQEIVAILDANVSRNVNPKR